MNTKADILTLEKWAADQWPPEEVEALGPWRLRAAGGFTKRANSVLAAGDMPDDPDWFERIRRFYSDRGLPAAFHISDSSPPELDLMLEDKGGIITAPCFGMIAPAAEMLAGLRPHQERAGVTAELFTAPDPAWMDDFMGLEGYAAEARSFYEGLLERMPAPKVFVRLVTDDGETVALGTARTSDEQAILSNIIVSKDRRGQGFAKALLSYLAVWCAGNGASSVFFAGAAGQQARSSFI
ncbi:GNAT family N-acetyltransferase [Paenibacillus sp. UNC499MF]|uniref:GNAT family N-acetyltransferase n=1 Tax=Paenibacillus sp. UNC499MF TaxID=1502751 RepID=UPI0008A07B50|nr:GNAT family N-acetyltransferase [Paenibacillus sp. UNC499MF]SEG06378.1 Acetyltransferase (GNAT) family protein [Paenibacillus sp. UNC499MF]